MEQEFAGKAALITAAAGLGIGKATAARLLAGGATVVITDSHERRTKEVVAEFQSTYGNRALGYVLDTGDRQRCEEVVRLATEEVGPVHILINNATVNFVKTIWDETIEHWDRVLEVNLTGAWNLCRLLMPIMRAAGGGAIVATSTLGVENGGNGIENAYLCTKGGLETLMRDLAHSGGPFNIRANNVRAGIVEDSKFAIDHPEIVDPCRDQKPLPYFPKAADIAEAIAFLVSDRARCITGHTISVGSGLLIHA
jgi:NAD(P)-dependent dehydrogenase (short-subunit alcohol dehydrogenase family)